jgi:cytochrome c oxidase assembly protein subunit 15
MQNIAHNFVPVMTTSLQERSSRPVAIWLLLGVGMIIIQILLGGITRLTGSGLSITEWNVVTGALPPLNEQQWLMEFEKYRQTTQFRLLNFDFTISDFKSIFFWEWFHRVWARLIGFVFIIPFVWFLFTKQFKKQMVQPMLILFLLGALQGAIGWIMVASGLTGDAIYVKPTKLALHFVFALGLLTYTFWFALELLIPKENRVDNKSAAKKIYWILVILFLQLTYGALMAGHKAATAAPTWPDINGEIIPQGLVRTSEGWLNWIDNTIAVHFVHRGLAYLLLILIGWLTYSIKDLKGTKLFQQIKWLPLVIVFIQVLLGIFAVLTSLQIVPGSWGLFEWMAQIHQLVAMLLLMSLVLLLYFVRSKE